MATLGQMTTTLQDHEDRLINQGQALDRAAAERVNLDSRLTTLELNLLTKLLSMMGKDKVEGLMWKPAKDCVPKTFTGERAKFRTWAQDVMVWGGNPIPRARQEAY